MQNNYFNNNGGGQGASGTHSNPTSTTNKAQVQRMKTQHSFQPTPAQNQNS